MPSSNAAQNTRADKLHDKAANETGARDADARVAYTLTPALHKRYLTLAMAIATETLKPLPSYLGERLDWLGGLQATAWGDREAIAQVSDEEQPMTAEDLTDFGHRIEFARHVDAARTLPRPGVANDLAQMPDGALWAEMVGHRGALCDALMLRFARDPASRDAVVAIRAAKTRREAVRALRALLLMFDDRALAAWVSALPRGEGSALARLRALFAEWTRRGRSGGVAPVQTVADNDLMRRAYALACEPVARVLRVGRYLTRGVPGREGDYAGYRVPRRVARATEQEPVTPPAPAGPTA